MTQSPFGTCLPYGLFYFGVVGRVYKCGCVACQQQFLRDFFLTGGEPFVVRFAYVGEHNNVWTYDALKERHFAGTRNPGLYQRYTGVGGGLP